MRTVPARLVGALAASLLLTGCVATPAASPTPTPVPTFLCTPEAGGAEYPCDQRAYDEMKATDALYAEAEEVFRRFFEEDNRIQLSGDYTITPIIQATTSGKFREKLVVVYGQLGEMKISGDGGEPELKWVHRQPDLSRGGSEVALETCVDATAVVVLEAGTPAGKGLVTRNTYFFSREGTELKIIEHEGSEAAAC